MDPVSDVAGSIVCVWAADAHAVRNMHMNIPARIGCIW